MVACDMVGRVTWWVGQVMWWAGDMVDMVSVVTWWVFIRAKDWAGELGEGDEGVKGWVFRLRLVG